MDETNEMLIYLFNRALNIVLLYSSLYFWLGWEWFLVGVIGGFAVSIMCFILFLYNESL